MRAWLPAALAGLLLLVVTFVGPWPAARAKRPELFESNRELVLSAARSAHVGHGPLRFAFAKREITPHVGEPLAGYGERWWKGTTCTGASQQLWARALGLAAGDRVVCILALDMLCVTRDLRDRALAELGKKSRLSPDSVLFSATHTHSGPGGYSPGAFARPFLGAPNEASRDRIVQAIAESVDEATRPLLEGGGRAAGFRTSRVEDPDDVRNRLQSDLPVDAAVTLIEVVATEPGSPPDQVSVLAYGAHATQCDPHTLVAKADYPGNVVAELAALGSGSSHGDKTVDGEGMFLAGAVGSQAPAAHREISSSIVEKAREGREQADLTRPNELSAYEVEIDLPHASPRIGPFRVSPVLAGSQIPSTASLRFLRVGPLVIAAAPGDLSGELSLRAKKAVEGPGRVLLPISFSGDYHGYLLPEERADLPGYEPAMMWHGPEGGELVTDALVAGARAAFDAH